MKFSKKNAIIIGLICFTLLMGLFKWIHYLFSNKYIMECFTPSSKPDSNSTSNTSNMPLTTTYTCQNFCGPTARCSITGQQCSADIDCPGCNPGEDASNNTTSKSVPGNDSAGKLTFSSTPQYSPLTTGYGTQEKVITSNMYSKPVAPNFGQNIWFDDFIEEQSLFNKRYKPPSIEDMPNYEKRYSLTGEFEDDGPLPSNSPL